MRLLIEHDTCYRYRQPVHFQPHRLMLMPAEGHDVSVISVELACSPQAEVSWLQDVFGNSVAMAHFAEPADTLTIASRVLIERHQHDELPIPPSPEAMQLPPLYSSLEWPDLLPTLNLLYPQDRGPIQGWVHEFISNAGVACQPLLATINQAICDRFEYRVRLEPGIQSPAETLRLGSGTCRDFALLMMETARTLGAAARFVSGYLYDPAHDSALHGTGYTHAWAQVYLPGPGWVEYDPTNGLVDAPNLLRVAVAREPGQAVPVDGAYRGPPNASLGMEVAVRVTPAD